MEPNKTAGLVYARGLTPTGEHIVGVRNHLLIIPAVFCMNSLVEDVAKAFPLPFGDREENRVIALPHSVGCCSVGFDAELGRTTLVNTAMNANVGGILIVSLGCGQNCTGCALKRTEAGEDGELLRAIYQAAAKFRPDLISGDLIQQVIVQQVGFDAALQLAVESASKMLSALKAARRVEVQDIYEHLVVGVMNGSSDSTSGLFTNPAVGHFCDMVMKSGRVAFSQTLETLGAEKILLDTAKHDHDLTRELVALLASIGALHHVTEKAGVQSEPTDGNVKGGLSTLAEKSVGTVAKFGHDDEHRLVAIVRHGSRIPATNRGLCLVDGPGQDILCLTGLVAAGCQVVLFTTGRGTPTGSAIAPTVKIAANFETSEIMGNELDVRLSRHLLFEHGSQRLRLEALAEREIAPAVREIAGGRRTRSEVRGQHDFQVRQFWPIE